MLKTIRAASENSSEITGLKTGFVDFDRITYGLPAWGYDCFSQLSMGKIRLR